MASKRSPSPSRSAPAAAPSSAGTGPVFNALLLAAAVGYGLSILVSRGKLAWPPDQLLASLYTGAGCLAPGGPVVLARGGGSGSGAGRGGPVWVTGGGGLLV